MPRLVVANVPLPRPLTRREAVALAGAVQRQCLARSRLCRPLPCIVRPAADRRPLLRRRKLNRADIRSDPASREVARRAARADVQRLDAPGGACAPLAGAQVDVWHCDAAGLYSDAERSRRQHAGPEVPPRLSDDGPAASRGSRRSIPAGIRAARCTSTSRSARRPAAARGQEFTSQIYFDDAVTDLIHAQEPPYARRGTASLAQRGRRSVPQRWTPAPGRRRPRRAGLHHDSSTSRSARSLARPLPVVEATRARPVRGAGARSSGRSRRATRSAPA